MAETLITPSEANTQSGGLPDHTNTVGSVITEKNRFPAREEAVRWVQQWRWGVSVGNSEPLELGSPQTRGAEHGKCPIVLDRGREKG
ncbi:hypothetical protein Acr_00g0036250 [Actinidia rufa]|uniref:Uncharacterized protein n=1 Tax=Actinidia rufa TaxID=165716 RepID=A0A7J0DIF0_9ERIC|nr:hypothetical protein Acr_00g0036250 [Actinidia rufa]